MTNEQKCFCGAPVDEYGGWVDGKISLISCTNPDCWMHGDTQPEIFEKIQHQIKSAINKEKAAAVQEERERVDCKTCSRERGCSSQISIMTVSGRMPIDISGCSAHELKFALKKKLISKMK